MLSERLLTISKLIDRDKVVFDVGSDHALLPCFLVREGICPKAYAADNKEGPLNRAKETIRR
ncbi:MAG: tRNA (adenine(22)-N(1))-methyltransferase TrmK, partial [Erysipelotrichaceae bacterium]|nr:tRNA (adenine(22)-N(1))-methyltransferase TrmK [Erysipelotrichaceae bacterium]